MESILQDEVTYPQTRASGSPPPVREAQANAMQASSLYSRDALQLQLNSGKKMDQDIRTTNGDH